MRTKRWTTALLATAVSATTAALLVGCTAAPDGDDAESQESALRKQCLDGDCPAPIPHPTPRPRPPPKPQGIFTVPIASIRTELQDVFAGAVIQISQTGETPEVITQDYQDCVPGNSPAKQACLAKCLDLRDSIEIASCRKACSGQPGIICGGLYCASRQQSSFLKVSSSAIPFLAGNDTCSAASCPACSGDNDPKVKDRLLEGIPAPVYSGFGASCYVKKIRWDIDTSTEVEMDSSGLHITFTGTSSSPAIHCDGGPDVDVVNPKIIVDLQPKLDPYWQTWSAIVNARFAADVHMHDGILQPIAWLFDLQGTVEEKATRAISSQVKNLGPTMGAGIAKIVGPYIPANSANLDPPVFTPNGMVFTYTLK